MPLLAVGLTLVLGVGRASAVEPLVYANGAPSGSGWTDGAIFKTDPTGSGYTQLIPSQRFWTIFTEGGPELAVSPDGQTIIYGQEIDSTQPAPIRVMDNDGRNHRTLGTLDGYDPEFGPDGKTVYYAKRMGPNGEGDIYRFDWTAPNPAATEVPVISQTWDQQEPSVSGDGTRLVYQSNGTSNSHRQIFAANSNGTAIRQLTTGSNNTFLWADLPSISPDGTKVVFRGERKPGKNDGAYDVNDDYDLWIINWDGTGLTRLTNNNLFESNPDWSPDGTHIIFERGAGTHLANGTPATQRSIMRINPNGTGESTVLSNVGYTDLNPQYRQASTSYGYRDFLAQEFRPIVYFDSQEHYRPLDVDQFLAEGSHRLCITGFCNFLTTTTDLQTQPTGAWIDINGCCSEDQYHSPNPSCNAAPLRDCDTGSAAAIYYDATKVSATGYRYFNYWFFYRFNDWNDLQDIPSDHDHEGDWENVAVAVSDSGNQSTFDYVNFGQHGTNWNYLRQNMACDTPDGDVTGGATACGLAAQRVHAFPARGSHATYPDICDGSFPELCGQSTSGLLEQPHGGQDAWGRNYDPTALKRFPATTPPGVSWANGPRNFVDWPGKWGDSSEFGDSPDSPGLHSTFTAPWNASCAPGNSNSACSSAHERPRKTNRAANAKTCSSWFGSNVRAIACTPKRLHKAIVSGSLGHPSKLKLTLKPGKTGRGSGRRRSAGGPGIAQLIGDPLRAKDRLVITGMSKGTRVYVRARTGAKLVEARIPGAALRQGRAVVTVRQRPHRLKAAGSAMPLAISVDGGRTMSVQANQMRVLSLRR